MAYCAKHFDAACTAIEDISNRVYRLSASMEDGDHLSDGVNGISLDFHPEPEKNGKLRTLARAQPVGTTDPWSARWRGHRGTGQTATMALLELESSMKVVLQTEIERAEARAKEIQAHADAMRKLMAAPNQSDG